MISCPKCGVWTAVLETRTKPDNTVQRTLACANLHRFQTTETVSQMLRPTKAVSARVLDKVPHR